MVAREYDSMNNWLNTVSRVYTLLHIVDISLEHHHFCICESWINSYLGWTKPPLWSRSRERHIHTSNLATCQVFLGLRSIWGPPRSRRLKGQTPSECIQCILFNQKGFIFIMKTVDSPRPAIWSWIFSARRQAYGLKGGHFEFPSKHFFYAGKDFQPLELDKRHMNLVSCPLVSFGDIDHWHMYIHVLLERVEACCIFVGNRPSPFEPLACSDIAYLSYPLLN